MGGVSDSNKMTSKDNNGDLKVLACLSLRGGGRSLGVLLYGLIKAVCMVVVVVVVTATAAAVVVAGGG